MIDSFILPEARLAIKKLNEAGFDAYLVGGCVRDALMEVTPHDFDITTSALPTETEAVFADYRVIETGMKHGTITVILAGIPLEITTFRADGTYTDHRHPDAVSFSRHIEDDLSRRDFTVNAMAWHPQTGTVDLFDGQKDLTQRLIRCVGDPVKRFEEDGLRILRTLRFASVLNFRIDDETDTAVRQQYPLLQYVSAERIREEFFKLICGQNAVAILRKYREVFAYFIPELAPMFGFEQHNLHHCFDVWEHTLHALEVSSSDLILRLALLFHDIGKPSAYSETEGIGHFYGHPAISEAIVRNVLKRLKTDNKTIDSVCQLVGMHDYPLEMTEKCYRRLLSKIGEIQLKRLIFLQFCDGSACAVPYRPEEPEPEEQIAFLNQLLEKENCLKLSDLKIDGNDLQSIGIPEGKQIGVILHRLFDAVLNGVISNERELLLDYANKIKTEEPTL